MPNPNNYEVLLKEPNILRVFSEDKLIDLGINGSLLNGLKNDSFQNHRAISEGYLGALVLNYFARIGYWNNAANEFVLAIPFSECISYDLTELLEVKDNERSLAVEKNMGGENDLYIAIADLHFFTDTGEGKSLAELATKYYRTKNPSITNMVLNQAKETIKAMAISLKVKSNLPKSISIEELCSAGFEGLWEALKSYDPSIASFETHYGPRVIGAMKDRIRELDQMARLDRTRLTIMKEFRNEYFAQHKIKPNKEDYKAHWCELGWPEDSFNFFYHIILLGGGIKSLEQLTSNDDSDSDFGRTDIIEDSRSMEPSSILMSSELRQLIEQDLKTVPSKFHPVFQAYLFERKSMKEIGELFDLSESRVSQLCTQYLRSPDFFKRTRKYLGITDVIHLKL